MGAVQGEEATIEAVPGGLFRILMGNGMCARGQFVELVPDKMGGVHVGMDRPGGSTAGLDDRGDRPRAPGGDTLIRLTHRDLPPDHADVHRVGWEHYLARLGVCAAGGDPGPDP